MPKYYDRSFASGKIQLDGYHWKYNGKLISHGVIYFVNGFELKIFEDFASVTKNGVDMFDTFEEVINLFNDEPLNGIKLSVLLKRLLKHR